MDQPSPQDPITLDVPPLPGTSTHPFSPLEDSPTLLGSTTLDTGFLLVTGRHTTPLRDAILPPPDPAPEVIVDRYPTDFNFDV